MLIGWTPEWLAKYGADIDKTKVILLNTEQLASGSSIVSEAYLACLRDWYVADYHESNISFLNKFCILPIIPSSAVAYGVTSREKDTGVLFYGSMNDRRSAVVNKLKVAGVVVQTVSGKYGWDLAPLIVKSRIVLHAHYYDTKLFPVVRFLQPAMQRVPIVCETSEMSPHNDWTGSGIVFADYDNLVGACLQLLADQKRQWAVAEATLRFVSAMRVGQEVDQIIGS